VKKPKPRAPRDRKVATLLREREIYVASNNVASNNVASENVALNDIASNDIASNEVDWSHLERTIDVRFDIRSSPNRPDIT